MSHQPSVAESKQAYEWFLALDEGQPAPMIAKVVGMTPETIREWRKMLKRGQRPNYDHSSWVRTVPKTVLDQAEKYIDEGMSFEEISRTMHISVESLQKYFPGRAWKNEQVIDFATTVSKLTREMKRKEI